MNLMVYDNFLPYPNVIRTWALRQQFYTDKEMTEETGSVNTWPGVRTKQVFDLDVDYANNVLGRIAHLAQHHFGITNNIEIKSSFQCCSEKDGESWIHTDHDVLIAGLLYLSPNAPFSAGTTLYSDPPHEIVDSVGNKYNRLVMYRSDTYHKSTHYFGKTLEDSRLTQVFFVKGN